MLQCRSHIAKTHCTIALINLTCKCAFKKRREPDGSFLFRSNEVLTPGQDLRLPIPTGYDDETSARRGSDSSLTLQQQQPPPSSNFFNASIDSVEDEEDDVEKRANGVGRRTSKLSDLFDKKRRPDRKRWKDKQGLKQLLKLRCRCRRKPAVFG
jgi:hypothetical protein